MEKIIITSENGKDIKQPLSFINLKEGDKFRVLNDGWDDSVFIYDDSLQTEKHRQKDRLIFKRADGKGSMNIPGGVQWKLKLKRIE